MPQRELNQSLQLGRKNSSLTQAEVAEKLYVSRQAVSNWEVGKTTPDIYTIQKLAALYGVSVDGLLQDNKTIEKPKVFRSSAVKIALAVLVTSRLITLGTSSQLLWMDLFIVLCGSLLFLLKKLPVKTADCFVFGLASLYGVCALYPPVLANFGLQVAVFLAAILFLGELIRQGFSKYLKGVR